MQPPDDGSKWWEPGHPWLHENTGNNFLAWFHSTELLTTAAKRVYDDTTAMLPDGQKMMLAINSVSAMLTGLAIECALKGLWVRAGEKLVVDGRFQRPPNAGDHELGQLARQVAKRVYLPLTNEELNVRDRLSALVSFAGRYPISVWPEQMKARMTAGGEKFVPGFFSDEDFAVASRLLNAFMTALNPYVNRFKLASDAPQ